MSITPSGVVWRLLKKNLIWSRCTTSVTSVTHFFRKIARCSSCSVACFIRQLVSWWALTFESVHNIKWLWAQTTKIIVKESLENLLPCMRSIAPKFLRTPAVQIPYEMLCLHPLQLPCSVVDALYQLVEKAPQPCSTIGVKGVAQGHVAVVHHHLDHFKSFV